MTYTIESLKQIMNKIQALVKSLDLKEGEIPGIDNTRSGTGYYLTTKEGYLYMIFRDLRGEESIVVKTDSEDEFLFKVLKNITFMSSFRYELERRIPGQDPRIIAFKRHVQILSEMGLNEKYIKELKLKYESTLRINLFEDNLLNP
jgi:hypothetical protein